MTVHDQVTSLTEDDIARIAERERQERGVDTGNDDPERTSGSDLLEEPASRQPMPNDAELRGSIGPPSTSLSKPRLLMGVPVPEGPNVTKFLYIEVPEDTKQGSSAQDGSVGSSEFDVEEAAARLCADLHGEGIEGQSFLDCLSSLKVTLNSR